MPPELFLFPVCLLKDSTEDMWDESTPTSPTWSCYDGVVEEREFAFLAETDPQLTTTLGRAAKKITQIARGAQGAVYSAYLRTTDHEEPKRPVVIKRLFAGDGSCYSRSDNSVSMQREVDALSKFYEPSRHAETSPLVVQCTGVLLAPSREKCLILEHCPFDLSKIVIRSQKRGRSGTTQLPLTLSANVHKYLLYEVLRALKHIHDNNVVHRDMKLSNILVRQDGSMCLADFGSCRDMSGAVDHETAFATPAALRTTLLYRSPEALVGGIQMQDLKAQDCWGAGVVFAEILKEKHLFSAHGELAMITQLFSLVGTPTTSDWPEFYESPVCQSFQFQHCGSSIAAKFAHTLPESGMSLLCGLLTANPRRRLTVDQALAHAFFSEGNWISDARSEWAAVVADALAKQSASRMSPQSTLFAQLLLQDAGSSQNDIADSDDDVESSYFD